MTELNRVLLIGHLTRDPEVRNLPSGDPVCELRLASNRRWKDQQTSEKREEACFVDVKVYGKQATSAGEWLHKGREVLVEGRLRYEEWEKDGQKRSKHVIVADHWSFVGTKPEGDGEHRGEERTARTEPQRPPREAAPARRAPARPEAPVGEAGGDEGDLPF